MYTCQQSKEDAVKANLYPMILPVLPCFVSVNLEDFSVNLLQEETLLFKPECVAQFVPPPLKAQNARNYLPRPFETKEEALKDIYSENPKEYLAQKKFKCDSCDKTFSRPSILKLHALSHQGIKIFNCKLCDKRFSYKCNLMAHMRVHSGVKPFMCEVCSKRFSSQSQLNEHFRVHSNKKPFRCEECEMCFRRYSSLSMHLRVHSGERPYVCEFCSKAFASSGNLKVHRRIHVRFI